MAVVTINVGQCGNQLGFDVLNSLFDNLKGDIGDIDVFFRSSLSERQIARTVCLDTEPKVVLNSIQKSQKKEWAYDANHCVFRHGGAGNNWAMGYQMCSGEFLEKSIDSIRFVEISF